MRRREFIALVGSMAAGWPLAARSQQGGAMRRIGVLMLGGEIDSDQQARIAAFREALEKLGWAEGRNVRIDLRFAAVDPERIRSYSAALLSQAPDVILANGTPVLEAFQKQTRSVPIVFVGVSDPVSAGFVPSLARPGGNITGFSNFEYTIGGKWLEILTEAAPATKRVAVLLAREDPAWSRYLPPIEALAPSFGVQLTSVFLGDPVEIERTFDAFAREPNGGVIATNNPKAMDQRELIGTLAARYRLPAVYPARVYVTSGGLMSYGIDPVDPFWRAASYVDRILKGEKPADLPVQAPTKYELVINLKAAKALGIDVPPTLSARADEVIE
jgi:putative tryptophan/tyrosine transport system substrate-binding protein